MTGDIRNRSLNTFSFKPVVTSKCNINVWFVIRYWCSRISWRLRVWCLSTLRCQAKIHLLMSLFMPTPTYRATSTLQHQTSYLVCPNQRRPHLCIFAIKLARFVPASYLLQLPKSLQCMCLFFPARLCSLGPACLSAFTRNFSFALGQVGLDSWLWISRQRGPK